MPVKPPNWKPNTYRPEDMPYSVKASITEKELELRIAALSSMSPRELREEWGRVWGTACYSHNYALLRRRIAWRLRCLCYGGLAASAVTKAEQLADLTQLRERTPHVRSQRPKVQAEIIPAATKVEASDTTSPTARLATPGTFAQKEFNGRTYTVYALDGGRFAYDGSTYKSLTAVAREIAGFRISGNRFFSTNTTFSTK